MVLLSLTVGCQSRAHNDLYRQRMANEIRVLEDQLYDADYQNKVLQEQLTRAKERSTPAPTPVAPYGPPVLDLYPNEPTLAPPSSSIDMEDGFDDILIDPGTAFDPAVAVPTDRLDNPFQDEDAEAPPPGKESQPRSRDESPAELESPNDSLPLPPPIGGPEPPGKLDTEFSPIEPGELLPPPDPDSEELPAPPGQIKLPDAVKATQPNLTVPETLKLHLGLSGGHHSDAVTAGEKADGLYLVIHALDRRGVMVDLDRFEVDAELTIVVLDPERDPADAKIGRWEFDPDQTANLVRSKPISGLHVPITWQDKLPKGDAVIVHVRLRSEADEMRCEGKLNVDESSAIAKWLPRADEPPVAR
ncbi:hypothetical protein [Planctomycetes bacterium CA13]